MSGGEVASLFQPEDPDGVKYEHQFEECAACARRNRRRGDSRREPERQPRATDDAALRPPRVASFPIVFRSKDAKTGLEIRTTQTKIDEIVVEVKDATVAIRKTDRHRLVRDEP